MQGVHNKVNFDRKLSVVANTKTTLHGKIAKKPEFKIKMHQKV